MVLLERISSMHASMGTILHGNISWGPYVEREMVPMANASCVQGTNLQTNITSIPVNGRRIVSERCSLCHSNC